MKKDLLNVDELAELLDVPKSWVYRQTREHYPISIPRYYEGRYLRFDIDELLEWLREGFERINERKKRSQDWDAQY